ncbi:hypothetical protein HanIR_Chr11g0532701 [Helianthus annuus]|nr:hypothetical protein HanIR_Chr11g0532701 [Helianthus annuus]
MMMCHQELVRGYPCFACRTLGRTTEECRDVGLEPDLTVSKPSQTEPSRTEPSRVYTRCINRLTFPRKASSTEATSI